MQQILFILVLLVVAYFAYKFYGRIWRNIRLGKPMEIEQDSKGQRWRNVLLVAFGQKKMFKRIVPAVMHAFIYVAFLFTQIELIEILIDGIFGVHRFFANPLGGLYTLIISLIEILSALALIGTVVFLVRRLVLRLKRFGSPEMMGWPKRDAILILIGELLLIFGIFSMNSADGLLQQLDPAHYPSTGTLPISNWIGQTFLSGMSVSSLKVLERLGWWLHALVVFGFILYLPFSKHLHIFLAFPNTFFAKLNAKGTMANMPDVMKEVKSMLGLGDTSEPASMETEMPVFGADDVPKLSQLNILNAYTCTECGRCTSVCPANQTGKKLSPRKVMMDVRDRAEEIGKAMDEGNIKLADFNDDKSLFDRITKEEIYACTSCNACVEACPVLINPLDIILQLRRFDILNNAAGPADWTPMFNSLENGGAVWQMPKQRADWVNEMNT